MHYDPEANIMSLELTKKAKINRAVKFGDFIIHVSQANTPVLIEILNASKITKHFDKIKKLPIFKKIPKEEAAVANQLSMKND